MYQDSCCLVVVLCCFVAVMLTGIDWLFFVLWSFSVNFLLHFNGAGVPFACTSAALHSVGVQLGCAR